MGYRFQALSLYSRRRKKRKTVLFLNCASISKQARVFILFFVFAAGRGGGYQAGTDFSICPFRVCHYYSGMIRISFMVFDEQKKLHMKNARVRFCAVC